VSAGQDFRPFCQVFPDLGTIALVGKGDCRRLMRMAAGVEGRCPLKPEKVRQHRRLLTALSPPGHHRSAQNETPRAMALRPWSVTRHHGGDRAAPIGQPIDDLDTSWEAGPCLCVPANDFLRCPSSRGMPVHRGRMARLLPITAICTLSSLPRSSGVQHRNT
jgi:hypothetical protein